MTREHGQSVDRILFEREVRGLKVPVTARLVLSLVGLGAVSYTAVEFDRAWSASLRMGMIVVLGTLVGMIACNAYFLALLRRRRQVHMVGLVGALMDSVFMVEQVIALWAAGEHLGVTLAQIYKSDVPMLFAGIVVVNGLALQPRYPLIATTAATLTLSFCSIAGALDPRTVFSADLGQTMGGGALEPPQLVTTVFLVLAIGASVTFITAIARRTVREAITRELENARLQREQLELVMREKVEALARLVAGVSHEVNSPLGAITSSIDTQEKALAKVAESLPEDGEASKASKRTRVALEVATNTLASMRAAAQRLAKTEASLRGFARVDQADLQAVRLDDALQTVLSLIPAERRGRAELVEEYADDLPELHVDARAINQLFMTLLENAFEAVDGEGKVEIRASRQGDAVVTTISDNGRGMDEETQRALFDVTLRNRTGRVAAGFGLPAGQSIAQRHHGDIKVASQLGKGTTFTVTLPVGVPPA